MALSPNYGFPEPDNSSLVKNGAQDIRALGDAVDTAVWNVGFGQAGKNKIINGDFSVNQRAFTSTTQVTGVYTYDRYATGGNGGTTTYSAQTFATGTAPVAGYESKNYLRIVTSGQAGASDYAEIYQRVEDVRSFAGQTITLSFWAKANTGTPVMGAAYEQIFGAGGSSSVVTATSQVTLSTSWARYSITTAIPSIAGKTIGTNSSVQLHLFTSIGSGLVPTYATSAYIQNNTFDIWGLQIEYGSKATPFQTASGGSPQAELAMCQRYYHRTVAQSSYGQFSFAVGTGVTSAAAAYQFPTTMRVIPTTVDFSNIAVYPPTGGTIAITAFTIGDSTTASAIPSITVAAGLVAGTMYRLGANNNSAAYIGFGAEL